MPPISFKDKTKEKWRYTRLRHPWIKTTAESILHIIICPLCWPIQCCFLLGIINGQKCGTSARQEQHRKREQLSEMRHEKRIQALENRKRSPSVDRKGKKGMNTQEGCSFLSKLPVEVRLRVYEMVFGGRVHVRTREENHERGDGFAMRATTCVRPEHLGFHDVECFKRELSTGRLNLFLTCRKVYREAIDILYSATTFGFARQQDFPLFLDCILPQRRNRIRHIVFEHNTIYQQYGEPWPWASVLLERTMSYLTEMPKLRTITTTMYFHTNSRPFDRFYAPSEFIGTVFASERKRLGNCRVFVYVDAKEPLTASEQFEIDNGRKALVWNGWALRELIEV